MPDILDNAYVIVDYDNGVRSMLDLCMFAEGSQNEQEICVVCDNGKVCCNLLYIGHGIGIFFDDLISGVHLKLFEMALSFVKEIMEPSPLGQVNLDVLC